MKVIRVLMFEGPQEWMTAMLDRSWLKPDKESPSLLGAGKAARELLRITDQEGVEDFLTVLENREAKTA